MRRFLPGLVVGAVLVAAVSVGAFAPTVVHHLLPSAPIEVSRGKWTTAITNLALTSARWTGWINVTTWGAIALEVTFTDANASCEAVTMRCESDDVGDATNDAGADIHAINLLSNGTTSAQYIGLSRQDLWCNTGSNTTCGGTDGTAPGSSVWTWTVDDLPDYYVNCVFDCVGTPAASDTVTVKWRGISP